MRLQRSLTVSLLAVLASVACEHSSPVEQAQSTEPMFEGRKVSVTPQCDLKRLPAKDFFETRAETNEAKHLLSDLSDECVLKSGDAFSTGMTILGLIEDGRWIPSAREYDKVFEAGEILVQGVWEAMIYAGGSCTGCTSIRAGFASKALEPGGAFGVRLEGADPVYSMGDEFAVRWGIEPPLGTTWDQVLPERAGFIYGFPGETPVTDEVFLGGDDRGFDWNVQPWTASSGALLVGNCVDEFTNRGLIAHTTKVLPRGTTPTYCEPDSPDLLLTMGFGEQAVRLASLLVPFWPRELNATLLAKSSVSGSARDFSPFYGFDVPPNATVVMTEPVAPTPVGDLIVFCDDQGNCGPLEISWTTEAGSILATQETVTIFTKDNNGSWVAFLPGVGPTETCIQRENHVTCTCDAGEGTGVCGQPGTPLTVTGLKLNKPGGYQLCVQGAEGGSGLNIAKCTETFHISPK